MTDDEEAQRDAATARAVSAEERASKAETLATAERQTRDEVVRRVVELERDRCIRAGAVSPLAASGGRAVRRTR